MAHGVCELLQLKLLLSELGFQISRPITLYCDNKAAISIAHNPIQHDRTKHIEVDRHFIKEKLMSEQICIPYVPSQNQLTDVFTKGLPTTIFQSLVHKLGMCSIYIPA